MNSKKNNGKCIVAFTDTDSELTEALKGAYTFHPLYSEQLLFSATFPISATLSGHVNKEKTCAIE